MQKEIEMTELKTEELDLVNGGVAPLVAVAVVGGSFVAGAIAGYLAN